MAPFGTRKDRRVYRKAAGSVESEVERRLPATVMKKYFHVLVTHNRGMADEFTQDWGTATVDPDDRDRQIAEARDRYPESYVHYEVIELEAYA